MKIMIISSSNEISTSLAMAISAIVNKPKVQVIQANHKDALVKFLEEEPQSVLVCDYDESGNWCEEWNLGKITFTDIKSSASEKQLVLRCGVSEYKHTDYVKAPFLLMDLIKRLVNE